MIGPTKWHILILHGTSIFVSCERKLQCILGFEFLESVLVLLLYLPIFIVKFHLVTVYKCRQFTKPCKFWCSLCILVFYYCFYDQDVICTTSIYLYIYIYILIAKVWRKSNWILIGFSKSCMNTQIYKELKASHITVLN